MFGYVRHIDSHLVYISYGYRGREGEADDRKDKKDPGGCLAPTHFLKRCDVGVYVVGWGNVQRSIFDEKKTQSFG